MTSKKYEDELNFKGIDFPVKAGRQITHFVGLRAKLYSFKIEDNEVKKKKE